MAAAILCDCGHMSDPSDYSTGYGIDSETHLKYCYACCAERERAAMIQHGTATLYVIEEDGIPVRVTDWPGKLVFPVRGYRKGRHNIARIMVSVWFKGPDGFLWYGRQVGDNNQCANFRRTKSVK